MGLAGLEIVGPSTPMHSFNQFIRYIHVIHQRKKKSRKIVSQVNLWSSCLLFVFKPHALELLLCALPCGPNHTHPLPIPRSYLTLERVQLEYGAD